ncbi:MAG: dTDP-glucose 4,6-dehydratase [Candidatus Sumerlaeota bacterium]|nr:dTDP-glucose 4,6-dehydratase [Candidatus Sumerlaeota bacterium]
METMIVTGGAGFIGANFVRLALEKTENRVVVLDKLTYAGNRCSLDEVADDPRFVFVEGDIADRAAVEALFEKYQPSIAVNFAAESHVDRSIDDPSPFVTTNVVGTFVLLEAARKYFARLGVAVRERFRFLHISTDEVYGTLGETGSFSETTPYAPNSPYAASKAGADHLVRAWHETYHLPVLLTNCSNNYGPFQFPEKLMPLTILNLLDGRAVPVYGDGGNVRDWLYVEDHCEAILVVLRRGVRGEKYNIGGGSERANIETVEQICAALETMAPAAANPALAERGLKRYEDLITFVPDRPGHDRRYAIDASKIRRELGWAPSHTFEDGIRRTVRWYLDHCEWRQKVLEGKYNRQRLGLAK